MIEKKEVREGFASSLGIYLSADVRHGTLTPGEDSLTVRRKSDYQFIVSTLLAINETIQIDPDSRRIVKLMASERED